MVKAVHFEAVAGNLSEEDQGNEPAIRPRLGTDTSEDEAQIEKPSAKILN